MICNILEEEKSQYKSLKVLCPKMYTEKRNIDKHAFLYKRPTVLVSAVVNKMWRLKPLSANRLLVIWLYISMTDWCVKNHITIKFITWMQKLINRIDKTLGITIVQYAGVHEKRRLWKTQRLTYKFNEIYAIYA